jgi:putative Holliday junction resolvase
MRILGIDYGEKKIGLAFGDTAAGIAMPLDVIANRGTETLAWIADKVHSEDIGTIVVGAPLSVDSRHGPEQLEKTRAFIKQLSSVVSVPVVEEDESYTTAESLRLQREEGAEADEDALAAMLIAQAYLEKHRL